MKDNEEEINDWDVESIKSLLEGVPVMINDRISAKFFGAKGMDFKVIKISPEGIVLLNSNTVYDISVVVTNVIKRHNSWLGSRLSYINKI